MRINGRLSLALLPAPQLIAERITITGPDQETIQARSLTLAISLPALLHGRLHATSLTLISPHIDLPWPLPGGSAAITPPSWLAALHAQLQNGTVTLGQLHLDNINASVVTGADSAITVSGSGQAQGRPLSLTLALSGADAAGIAPLRIDAKSGNATAAFPRRAEQRQRSHRPARPQRPAHDGSMPASTPMPPSLTATTLQVNSGPRQARGHRFSCASLHPASDRHADRAESRCLSAERRAGALARNADSRWR